MCISEQLSIAVKKKKLFCFDLDKTLTNTDVYVALRQAGLSGRQQEQDDPSQSYMNIIDRIINKAQEILESDEDGGIKNRKELCKTMRNILKAEQRIAITSFGDYVCIIPLILEQIGLEKTEIEQIIFDETTVHRNFYDKDGNISFDSHYNKKGIKIENGQRKVSVYKNRHIANAIQRVSERYPDDVLNEVILIDDVVNNVNNLLNNISGIPTYGIIVSNSPNPNTKYIDEINTKYQEYQNVESV